MTRFSRRRFLSGSLAAAAAVSIGPYVSRGQSPNEKLGVAVVGVGGRGGDHLSAFVGDPRTTVLYIVDIDEKIGQDRCQKVAEKQGVAPKYVRDMREAFADPNVRVVSTATPNHWHALCGVWAMQAGKDVYIEKPVSHEIAAGSALVAAAEKYQRICQVGTQCRSSRAIREAVNSCSRTRASATCGSPAGCATSGERSIGPLGDYPVPDHVDFNLWSGPAPYTQPRLTRPQFHYDWHWQRLYGNGDSGQPGPAPDGHRPVGTRDPDASRQRDHVRRTAGIPGRTSRTQTTSMRETLRTRKSRFSTTATSASCSRRADSSVDNSADEELNKLFQSTARKQGRRGVLRQRGDSRAVDVRALHRLRQGHAGDQGIPGRRRSLRQFPGRLQQPQARTAECRRAGGSSLGLDGPLGQHLVLPG